MPEERITVEMEGSDADGGDVRLSEFIDELNAVQSALRHTQQWVTPDPSPVSYRVIELSHSSPSRVTIGIIARTPVHSDTPRIISRRFAYALQTVRRKHRYSQNVDPQVLESFTRVTLPLDKNMKSIKVLRNQESAIRIDRQFALNLKEILMNEYEEMDEIVGTIEALNIHDKAQFHIYPPIGPAKILCRAPVSLRTEVSNNAGKKVAVGGWAMYRKDAPFPHTIRVESITPLPSDDELPRLSDLHGIAPDATKGANPEDFVRGLRDARW
jgi:hypothetical protein